MKIYRVMKKLENFKNMRNIWSNGNNREYNRKLRY